MLKRITTLVLAISVILVVAGCKNEEATVESVKDVVIEEAMDIPTPATNSYLDKYINTNERPIAVMVDNDNKDARPQSGLDEAYLVYEMMVEGGSTRFMALFCSVDTEKIGPVRSSRHYFLDFVKENDAIYTHYGWSPKATTDISNLKVNNINGISGADSNIFWRERKFKGDWHSAYTSIAKIKERAQEKKYSTETTIKNEIKYSEEDITLPEQNIALEIVLPYSGKYKTSYNFNPETALYEKQINSAPHKMQNGNVLSFKNVIVQFIADKSLGDDSDRREIITTGSGKGYYFTNGAYEEITWSKSSRTAPTIYKKSDGSTLVINPGSTMINIISPNSGVNIK